MGSIGARKERNEREDEFDEEMLHDSIRRDYETPVRDYSSTSSVDQKEIDKLFRDWDKARTSSDIRKIVENIRELKTQRLTTEQARQLTQLEFEIQNDMR